jgi:hypothetical protein
VTPFEHRTHFTLDRFGSFRLTDAVRPGPGMPIIPAEGYRLERYEDRAAGLRIPVLSAAVSRERLFETFLRLLEPLGDQVDVVLETSHSADPHHDLRRQHIDRPVLESYLCEFEDLLLHDGCTGVAVIGRHKPIEVQFDEHKLLICYARDLKPFRTALHAAGIYRKPKISLIFDAPHLHYSRPESADRFDELARRLGVGAEADMVAG